MLRSEVRGRDEGLPGQAMTRPHHHYDLVSEERPQGQPGVARGTEHDREVDSAFQQGREGVVGGPRHHLEVYVGMGSVEQAQPRGQPVVHGVALGGEADDTPGPEGMAADLLLGAVELVEDGARGAQEAFPGGGQYHALADAVEEARPQVPFDVAELVTERGLGEVQPPARLRDAALLGDRLHQLQVAHLEHWASHR